MNAEPTTRASQELPGWTTVVDADGEVVALVRGERLAGRVLAALLPAADADVRTCVRCGSPSSVIDSRPAAGGVVRRRRRCDVCSVAWTTHETRARHSDDA